MLEENLKNIKVESVNIKDKDLSNIAKKAGIGGFGDLFLTGFRYLITLIMIRLLGANTFGIFVIAYAFFNIINMVSIFGINQGVLRYVAFYNGLKNDSKIKGTILGGAKLVLILSSVMTFIILFISKYIAINIYHKPELKQAIIILIISLPFLSVSKIWLSGLQAFQLIRYQTYVEKFFQPVIWFVFLLIFYFLGWGLMSVLVSLVISNIFQFIFSYYYLNKNWMNQKKDIKPEYDNMKLIKFSLPLVLAGFFSLLLSWIGVLMLGRYRTASEVGVYESAVRVASLIIIPLNSFNNIFAPMISNFYSKNELERINEMFKIVTKWVFSLSFPIFLIFLIFAKPIMNIFGKDFIAGVPVLTILLIAQLVNVSTGSVGYILLMTGHQNVIFFNSIFLCVISIVLNLFLIPKYGILGAGISSGITIVIDNLLRLGEVYYFLKMHPYKLSFWKSITAGVISAIICIILKSFISNPLSLIYLIAFVFAFIIMYVLIIYLFRFDEEDIFILKRIKAKAGI